MSVKFLNGFHIDDIFKYKKIICIDFGDGETAAALTPDGKLTDIENLNAAKGQKTIPTVISYCNGKPLIGFDAVATDDYIVNFKDSPENLLSGKKTGGYKKLQLVQDFFKELINNILSFNENLIPVSEDGTVKELDKKTDILLAIGCPSTPMWNGDNEKKLYARLISEATGIDDVIIIPESRAALINAKKFIRKNERHGIIVIDFGSITTDITYFNPFTLRSNKLTELSINLGAGNIESLATRKLMADNGVKESDLVVKDSEGKIVKGKPLKVQIYRNRLQKENYFSHGSGVFQIYDAKNNKRYSESADKTDFPEFINSVIGIPDCNDGVSQYEKFLIPGYGENTWYGHCKNFLLKAKEELGEEIEECGQIVLAGGASRMDFLKDLAEEVFDGIDVKSVDFDPSHGVSRGLCEIIRKDREAIRLLPDFKKRFYDEIVFDEALKKLFRELTKAFAPKVYEDICNALEEWDREKGDKYSPYSSAKKRIQNHLEKNCFSEDSIRKLIAENHESWRGFCEESLNFRANAEFGENIYQTLGVSEIKISSKLWDLNGKITLKTQKLIPSLTDYISLPTVQIPAKYVGGAFGFCIDAILAVFGTVAHVVNKACGDDFGDKIRDNFSIDMLKAFSKEFSNSAANHTPLSSPSRKLFIESIKENQEHMLNSITNMVYISFCEEINSFVNKEAVIAAVDGEIDNVISALTYTCDNR